MADTDWPGSTTVLDRPQADVRRGSAPKHRRHGRPQRSRRTRLIGILATLLIAMTPAATQIGPASANSRAASLGTPTSAINDHSSLASEQRRSTRPKAPGKARGAPAAAATTSAGPPARATPTRFGVSIQAGGSSYASAFSAANSRYGGLESYRKFFPGAPSPLPSSGASAVVASFHYPPRDVLTGRHDAALAQWFRAAPRQYPVYWVYSHEPEDDIARGQFAAVDYRAAWRHIRAIQRSVGRMDMKATLTLMCWTASPGSGRNYRDYYPGSDVIDVMAWDCYNYGRKASEQHYIPAAQMFSRVADLSASLGKPFGIAETASPRLPGDSSGNGRANWLRSIAAYLSQRNAVFVCYFDAHKAGSVDFRLTDSPSRTAWREIVSA